MVTVTARVASATSSSKVSLQSWLVGDGSDSHIGSRGEQTKDLCLTVQAREVGK
jgi:hypothetical protein